MSLKLNKDDALYIVQICAMHSDTYALQCIKRQRPDLTDGLKGLPNSEQLAKLKSEAKKKIATLKKKVK